MRHIYWQELWYYIPSTRKGNASSQEKRTRNLQPPSTLSYASIQSPMSPIGSDRGINTPSWINKQQSSALTNSSAETINATNNKNVDNITAASNNSTSDNNNNPWILPIIVGAHNSKAIGSTAIPTNIDNSFPCIYFNLGQDNIATPSLWMRVGSGTAINRGNLNYHRSIMSQFPDAVAEYIECGPGTKYDLVQRKVAVTQSAAEGHFNDCTLSAIIRYKNPSF